VLNDQSIVIRPNHRDPPPAGERSFAEPAAFSRMPRWFFRISDFERMDIAMAEDKGVQIHWHEHKVSSAERKQLMGHKGAVLWFTGLSGSGKSTIANTVDHKLHSMGKHTYVLDGDNIRFGLNKDKKSLVEKVNYSEAAGARFGVGFSAEDRMENIRRIGEVAKLFSDAAIITLTAFISPYRIDRDNVRKILQPGEFIEIYVDAALETCEKRDPKGLYKKARAGEIKGFTGIDDPYEAPEKPELVLDSNSKGIDELADEVIAYLKSNGYLSA
jgi:adenylylsulfate kinase